MSIEIAPNGLPLSSAWLFPEYDFAQMNPDEYAGVIMERILNRKETSARRTGICVKESICPTTLPPK